jgi:hypothetical protein
MDGYLPGVVVRTIDNPDDDDDQLVLVRYEHDGSERWFHSSELFPRNDDE